MATKTAPRFTKAEALALHARAEEAARRAAEAARPAPMIVGTPKDMMASLMGQDDGGFDEEQPTYYVSEGVCGMAWVTIQPGTSSYARRLAAEGIGHKAYYGGWEVYSPGFRGQSYDRATAAAGAYAEVLREAGVEAHVGSRLD